MSRLRFSVSLAPTQSEITAPGESFVTFAPMEAIMNGLGGLDTSRVARLGDLKNGSYNYFAEGDVLLAKVTPCFENGKKAYAHNLENGIGYATSEVFVIRPDLNKIDPNFLLYLMSSEDFRSHGVRSMTGTGGLKRVNPEAILNFPTTFYELEKQREVATYLDRETARIGGLIEKKARFIALLKEKRVAVIAHAVTKGLNRNAPMKDSGQGWLGEVPAHWEVVPSIWLFTESKERAHEDDEQLSATQKYGVIPLSEFERLEQRQVTKAFLNLEQRKHVEVGDFVISMRSMDGGLERAKARGCVRSSYVVLKSSANVDVDFFTYLFKSISYIQALRATSSFIRDGQDLSFWNFRAVKLPRLPLDEQVEIARFLSNETTRIDTLITKTEQSIALLKEKRAALITAAVTGKIDVRSAA
ncbi:restriction endonuclease subunit S [Roseovarius sp.]|uniref:restriction endonuclease subunit S n=1 Tax=Roseovarius sp. TaxID=1486281 RepID=UPI00262F9BE0|nr:restriction endonuclease subunit S [Roseovarius sp.]MDW3117997.1 restriction endonuclease subunit S [Roseovarius pacificus]